MSMHRTLHIAYVAVRTHSMINSVIYANRFLSEFFGFVFLTNRVHTRFIHLDICLFSSYTIFVRRYRRMHTHSIQHDDKVCCFRSKSQATQIFKSQHNKYAFMDVRYTQYVQQTHNIFIVYTDGDGEIVEEANLTNRWKIGMDVDAHVHVSRTYTLQSYTHTRMYKYEHKLHTESSRQKPSRTASTVHGGQKSKSETATEKENVREEPALFLFNF